VSRHTIPSHLVVEPFQVALRHSLLPYEVRSGPSQPTMSARVSIVSCASSTSAIRRPTTWTTMTTTTIGRQARCCHLTLSTSLIRLIPLLNMPASQMRTRSLIFRRCALVQNAQSRIRTTIIRPIKTLKRRRSADIFILPQLYTRTNRLWITRETRLIGINCRTKSLSPRWKSLRSRSASGLRTGTLS
jgi:hypothetical protein